MEVKYFSASWCGPCKAFKSKFEETARTVKGSHVFQIIDIDAQPEVASALNVRGIPTVVITENGTEVSRASGVVEIDQLLKSI